MLKIVIVKCASVEKNRESYIKGDITWLIKKLTSVSGSSFLNFSSGINPIEFKYFGVAPANAISSPIASWNPLFAPSLKH